MEKDNTILVSVMCTVFNHERYLERTLKGILEQKTSFRFEVIIHDDASTDNSAQIIKKYERLYPDQIHAIYQKENQYSKGVSIGYSYMFPVANGKYYAICEGDDYWTNPNKLEMQIQFMETHPECTLTAHAGHICYENGILSNKEFSPFTKSQYVSMDDLCSRWLFPTASIVYRAELRDTEIPFAKGAPCGDVPLVLYAALFGTIYYFDKKMCVYRRGAEYSLTTQWKRNPQKMISINERFISMLDQFDEYTNCKYSKAVDKFRISKEYNNCILRRDLKALHNDRYYDYYGVSIKRRMIVWLKVKMPKTSSAITTCIEKWRYFICFIRHTLNKDTFNPSSN